MLARYFCLFQAFDILHLLKFLFKVNEWPQKAGHLSGIQALVKAEEPRAHMLIFFAHIVNLVVQDGSDNVTG